jgi:hypothetical protein
VAVSRKPELRFIFSLAGHIFEPWSSGAFAFGAPTAI